MSYTITEVADRFGKSANSIKHIIDEQRLDVSKGITDDTVKAIEWHLFNVGIDYAIRGVKDTSPDGYILSSQDVHEMSGVLQHKVSDLCRKGVLDGCLVKTRNGASWFITEESLDRYMNLNHVSRRRNHNEILERARFDRFKEHLFSSPSVISLADRLGCSKEESIIIAITEMLANTEKETING